MPSYILRKGEGKKSRLCPWCKRKLTLTAKAFNKHYTDCFKIERVRKDLFI